MKRKISLSSIIKYIFPIFWSIMTIYPLVTTFMSSLKNNEEIFSSMFALPSKIRIENYTDALFGAGIIRAIGNSFFVGLGTTSVVIVVALLASYILSRQRNRITKAIYMLFLTGLMLPIYTTIIPISKIATSIKGHDSLLFLMLVYATFMLPQAIFLTTGYFNEISRDLDEAAAIDGCGMFGFLFRILMPISKPIISTVAILTFVYAYSELIFSVILLTSTKKYPISRSLMYFTGDYAVRMGPVFASIILAVLPMIVLYVIFHEQVQKGMLAGAIKG